MDKIRVLVVDDEPFNLDLIEAAFALVDNIGYIWMNSLDLNSGLFSIFNSFIQKFLHKIDTGDIKPGLTQDKRFPASPDSEQE